MRKFSVSLLAISFFIFTLCSCGVTTPAQPVLYFTANAKIQTPKLTMTALVSSSADKNITVTLQSPADVKGLSYHYTNSTLYIDYMGLKCTTNIDYLPSYDPIDVLYDTLSSMSYSQLKFKENNTEYDVYTSTAESGDFTVYIDSKSGAVSKIVPSYTDCEITFTDTQPQ